MKIFSRNSIISIVLAATSFIANPVFANKNTVLVQSTTSTANSGLYDFLLPVFEAKTGINVNVVAVGTGQAIRNARNCDADVLLVHAQAAEQAFVAEGYGVQRFNLMYNDFVLIGPSSDPASVSTQADINNAMQMFAASTALFASRGDDSGTHKKELSLWRSIQLDVEHSSHASWYRSTGSGMGATINTAIGLGAYTLSDRATWISFKNKRDYRIVFEGDPNLFNQYGVILVSSEKCPSVNKDAGQIFIDWLLSDEAQTKIAQFTVSGQQLFYPNANE